MTAARLSMPSPPWHRPAPTASQVLGPAPPPISRSPGTTVHGQIEDWLAELISVGRLAPGDRMPTEQDLAAWLGVSRMTLRHALASLARRGLVTRTVGRRGGTFVAESKLEQDLTTLASFSEQLRRHGMVAGARVLSATERPAGPVAAAALCTLALLLVGSLYSSNFLSAEYLLLQLQIASFLGIIATGAMLVILLGGIVSGYSNLRLSADVKENSRQVAKVPWGEADRTAEDFERLDKLRAQLEEIEGWNADGPPLSRLLLTSTHFALPLLSHRSMGLQSQLRK